MNQVQLNASHEASNERNGADGGGLIPDFAPAGAGRKAKLAKIIENSKRLSAEGTILSPSNYKLLTPQLVSRDSFMRMATPDFK